MFSSFLYLKNNNSTVFWGCKLFEMKKKIIHYKVADLDDVKFVYVQLDL